MPPNARRSQYPMAVVVRRTGLTPELIRAWERRHRAVEPSRSRGNQRLYSDKDVERLILLRRALAAGWQIGHVAPMRDAQIRALLEEGKGSPAAEHRSRGTGSKAAELVARCLDDIARLDAPKLQSDLDEAAVELGRIGMIDDVLVPLLHRMGDEYASGTMRIVNEHLASAVAAGLLESLQAAYPPGESSPAIIVTTPASQHHHLGALMVAATARMEGWHTTYLGPNLPAEEIAAAARMRSARVVALSIAYWQNDPALEAELERMARLLPEGAQIVVGGSAARSYQKVLDGIGAHRLDDLASLRTYLQSQRWRS